MNKLFAYKSYIYLYIYLYIYIYRYKNKQHLALNNPKKLMCHKTQPYMKPFNSEEIELLVLSSNFFITNYLGSRVVPPCPGVVTIPSC